MTRMLILLVTALTLLAIVINPHEKAKPESIKITLPVPVPVATDPSQAAENQQIATLEAENLKAHHSENPDRNFLKFKSEKIAKFEKSILDAAGRVKSRPK